MTEPDAGRIIPDAVYTAREAAALLRVHPNTLRALVAREDIDVIRVGRKSVRFKGSALLAFANRGGSGRPIHLVPDQIQRRPRMVA